MSDDKDENFVTLYAGESELSWAVNNVWSWAPRPVLAFPEPPEVLDVGDKKGGEEAE